MLVRIVIFLLVLFPFVPSLEAGFWDDLKNMLWKSNYKSPPMIDVLIVNNKQDAMLEVKGKYQVYDPHTRQFVTKRYMGKKKNIQALSHGLKWGEEFPGIYQIHIVPVDYSVITVVDGVEYKGSLFIYDIGGTISIVNRVSLEEHLSCVLPYQCQEDMAEETLAAIAIAARTNIYYQTQNPKNRYWAIDTTEVESNGLESKERLSEIEHAVRATRHMVLSKTGTYEKVITAFPAQWSISSGERMSTQNAILSRITHHEAEDMGKNGKHAAQILSAAFPGSHIELIY